MRVVVIGNVLSKLQNSWDTNVKSCAAVAYVMYKNTGCITKNKEVFTALAFFFYDWLYVISVETEFTFKRSPDRLQECRPLET